MSSGPPLALRLEPRDDGPAAAQALAQALEARRVRRGRDLAAAAYVRLEQPVRAEVDPLAWLRGFPALPRVYWGDRDGAFTLAGAGVADEAEGPDFGIIAPLLERIATGALADTGRLIVSARFDLGVGPDVSWAPFGRVRARLPLLELRQTNDACVLAVNLKAAGGLASGWFDAQRRSARKALLTGGGQDVRGGREPQPKIAATADPAAWRAQVETVLAEIRAGRLRKAVLARCAAFALEADPLTLFAQRMGDTPRAFHFFAQPSATGAFLGASPELLYRRRGRELETEALAGTRARGDTPEQDLRRERALLESEKDLREHEFVRRHIVAGLQPLSTSVQSAERPAVHTVAQLHHLRTPVQANLQGTADDAAILGALHPTPAVCGLPTDRAMRFLRAAEGFDRGLFGGPFGCVGRDVATFSVAIRSALVRPGAVQLYAGAGLVEGSDADLEWQETIDKMSGLAQLLKGDSLA